MSTAVLEREDASRRPAEIRYRILLADDHAEMRNRIRLVLGSHHDVIGEVSEGTAVISAVRELNPDILLLDITMPGKSGFEVLGELAQESPMLMVMVVTQHAENSYANVARERGARGYILKRRMMTDLLIGLMHAASGVWFASPGLA